MHRCTFFATELLNLYVRDRIENHAASGLESIFSSNWLLNAYYAVSDGRKSAKVDPALQSVFDAYMKGTFGRVDRTGVLQALTYECINLQAVGQTNVWMHFNKRVLSYTRSCFAIDKKSYDQLSKDAKKKRKLALLQVAADVCREPSSPPRSPESYHAWVAEQRVLLGIDSAVGDWGGKPLLYHLKAKPHKFVSAMHTMSSVRHSRGEKAFALFPLRRSHVPGHVRFDKKVLDDLLCLGCASAAAKAKKAKEVDRNSQASGSSGRAPKRKRDDPELLQEKAAVFSSVLDLRAAGVHRRSHFAFAFTSDGVSLHLNMEIPGKKAKKAKDSKLSTMPLRGVHSIDALKSLEKIEDLHVVGMDPGKRELFVAVDQDDPKKRPVVRYTLAQRQKHMRTRQYMDEARRSKETEVASEEEELSKYNSKAPSLSEFAQFAAARRSSLRKVPEIVEFYDRLDHRERRRKTKIKKQQSEADMINRLRSMHSKDDPRKLVLAYGAWGLVAGRPNAAANKGTPPAIGVGLMKKIALHFVVCPTPEHYTSKTCVRCMGPCGPHPTLKTREGKDIRGLRVCQHEGCGLLQNRDKTGATNIGLQFKLLFQNKPPIRKMDEAELEFNRLNTCLECGDS